MRAERLDFRFLLLALLLSGSSGFAQVNDALRDKQPVATVAGEPIYDKDLGPSAESQLLRLQTQEYEVKRKALDAVIQQKLLQKIAAKKGITTEKLLQQEVDAKVPDPSDAELLAYYLGQKDKLNRPLDEIRDQLRQKLKQAKVEQSRQDYLKSLPKDDVVVLLPRPKVEVSYDPARVRGNAKAPVMIVEFSDYQCPFCRRAEPTLKNLLAKYGDKLSVAYRDSPLSEIHPQAEMAAEASRCAGEQEKFWEYHDQLFSSTNLQRANLVDYARAIKIDDEKFDSCLSSGKYKAAVEQDVREANNAGVTGTPAFFINGVPLSGALPMESFVAVIDEQLAGKP